MTAIPQPAITYQETVRGCEYVLRDALENTAKDHSEQKIDYIVDRVTFYARGVYCEKLTQLCGTTGGGDAALRVAALKESFDAILNIEPPPSPVHTLFRGMKTMYAKVSQFTDYINKGPYGATANLFYAAANEAHIEQNNAVPKPS